MLRVPKDSIMINQHVPSITAKPGIVVAANCELGKSVTCELTLQVCLSMSIHSGLLQYHLSNFCRMLIAEREPPAETSQADKTLQHSLDGVRVP